MNNNSIRVYAVMDDNSIKKLANNRFYNLHRNDKHAAFPEFRNSKVKIAEFIVEIENRKPIRIINEFYNYYSFDDEGRINEDKFRVQLELIMNSIFKEDEISIRGNVIDATAIFLKKRIETQYKWHPDEDMKNRLLEKIFGQ
ncbi:MAG: hypothetical protein K9J16_05170 [Melioribacteraceae bacterium]|nr:hypothetical protein [Melioribacteraceae bacterium]MCF8354850.1 hypothetical protein [Melioribacteraceae bacterium]MCF8392957.1 hypothetical protein [Melioribacteraceae bacterium]MCF8417300.1 hypothetical protein [Melioribacteraceae bacterium]